MRIVTLVTLTFDKKNIFFCYVFTKWKLNKIYFIPVFWYFIKEIPPYDVEYGLNFDKNTKKVDLSKKSSDKS